MREFMRNSSVVSYPFLIKRPFIENISIITVVLSDSYMFMFTNLLIRTLKNLILDTLSLQV